MINALHLFAGESESFLVPLIVVAVIAGVLAVLLIVAVILLIIIVIKLRANNKRLYIYSFV